MKKLFKYRSFRFIIAGGINTLFSYFSFAILLLLVKNKEIVLTLNLFIAVTFNYMTSSRFVFQNSEKGFIKIFQFYGVYFITYLVNMAHLYITVDLLLWDIYIAQLSTLSYLPILGFILQRKLVFSNNEKND